MSGFVLSVLFAVWAEASDVDVAITPATYELGQLSHDDRILGAAEIANRSQKPVTIRSVRSNCGCYKVSCPPRDLLPGESATVEFDLTFPRWEKLHNPLIYILTDDKERPMRTLQMRMSLTEEAVGSQAEEGELVVEPRGEQGARDGSLEALGHRLGVVHVEERSGGGNRIAFRLTSGAEVEQAAKAYARHPEVSLVFLRADEAAESPAEIAKPAGMGKGEDVAAGAAAVEKRLAPLALLWFYSEGCAFCEDTKKLLKELRQKYGRNVTVSRHEISKLENYEKLIVLEEKFGVKGNDPMVLFVGDTFLSGDKDILAKLDLTVADQLAKGAPNLAATFLSPGGVGSGELVRGRFSSFSILAVVFAGLLDGLNPCAFTTLVFFVSFLTYLGRRKTEILSVGLAFSVAVFLAYLLIGLGLFRALFLLSAYRLFSDVLFYVIVTMLIAFAALSVYDSVAFSVTDNSRRIVLQLPTSFKRRIHDSMRRYASGKSLILGAVILGFVVSVFESVCTGQVYLPTIAFVLKNPDLRPQAVLYLVLYNLMFIVPLIAVFVMAFFGVTSESLGRFLKRRVALSKAALACFFAGLAVLLIRTR